MAATHWQSSTGDVGATASWSNGLPSLTNTPAICDGRSQKDLSINMDRGGANFSIRTTREFRGNIGGPGNPLQWDGLSNEPPNVFRGTGDVFLKTDAINNVVMDTPLRRGRLFLEGSITNVYCKSGTVIIDEKVTGGGLVLWLLDSGARVTLRKALTTEAPPGEVHMRAGLLVNERNYGASTARISMSGGRILQTGFLATATTLEMLEGQFVYAPREDQTSESPRLHLLGGTLDLSRMDQALNPGTLVIGPDGHIVGSAIELSSGITDTDLRETFP